MYRYICILGSILTFFLYCTTATGQPLNRVDDFGYIFNFYNDAVVGHEGEILGFGYVHVNFDEGPEIGVLIGKYTPEGALTTHRVFTDTSFVDTILNKLAISRFYGGLIPTSDGGYLFNAVTSRSNAIVVKLDSELEETFRYEYEDSTSNSSFSAVEPIEVEGGYLLYGTATGLDGYAEPFVRRINHAGETEWMRYYGEEGVAEICGDAAMVGDSILVMGCRLFDQSINVFYKIRITDGAPLGSWFSETDPEMGWIRELTTLPEGGIITYGLQPQSQNEDGSWTVQPVLSRLDTAFLLQWSTLIGYPYRANGGVNTLHDLKPVSDGNIIGSGQIVTEVNGEPELTGWLIKFTPEGDTLWSRNYLPPFEQEGNWALRGEFGRFGELPNGDLVVGGRAQGDGTRNCWLVRTNSEGCIGQDSCEYLVHAGQLLPPPAQPKLSVFPNPASRHLTVAWPGAAPTGTSYFKLYNMQGQSVWSVAKPSAPEVPLQLPELPPGVYALRVEVEGQAWVERVVIRDKG